MTPSAMYSEVELNRYDDPAVRHAYLVRRIARHLMGRLPPTVQFEDMLQAGMLGLLEAIQQYKPSQGANFATYATIRIRGAMIDEVRRHDWTPRSVHRKSRQASNAIRILEARLGREPRDAEIAAALELTVEEYHRILHDVSASRILTIDREDTEDCRPREPAAGAPDPATLFEDRRFREDLVRSIAELPERDQLIMSLYYKEELNLREVGEVLGVSESRVSQLLGRTMLRLRDKLREWVK